MYGSGVVIIIDRSVNSRAHQMHLNVVSVIWVITPITESTLLLMQFICQLDDLHFCNRINHKISLYYSKRKKNIFFQFAQHFLCLRLLELVSCYRFSCETAKKKSRWNLIGHKNENIYMKKSLQHEKHCIQLTQFVRHSRKNGAKKKTRT